LPWVAAMFNQLNIAVSFDTDKPTHTWPNKTKKKRSSFALFIPCSAWKAYLLAET
jgi:hypothetical protein